MNKIIKRYFIFIFTLTSIISSSCYSQTNWILSKSIEQSLGDIRSEELISSLKAVGVSAEITPFEKALKPYEIHKGQHFTIYLAPTFFQKDQVWILQNSSSTTPFENLTRDQLQELEEFRYLVGEYFKQKLGIKGYVALIDLKKDYCFGRPIVCLEMIPTPVNKLGEVDIQAKIKRSSYVLFGDKDLKTLSPVKAKQQVDSFKASLASLPSLKKQQRNTKNTLPWPRKITHWEDLKELSLQGLQEEFLTHYTLIEDSEKRQATSTKSKKDGDEGEFTQANNDEIKKCAFCDPKVIQNQFVYKFGDFVCLYNFRPYTPGYHFMITPYLPLHVENWQDFSLQDVLQIDQLAQAIVKSIKQESGQDDVVLFIQNGLAAGMTVPHSHMHVLLRPNKVHYYAQLLLEATGNKRKGLTSEEMDPVKTKFKNHLDKFLTIPNE